MKNEAFASQFPLGAWKAQPLAKIAEVFTDGDWIESKDQADSGVRLIQTGNVGIGQFKDRSEKARFIDEATFSRLKCFEVIPGDLLISRLPDPVGRACIVPDTAQKMITAVDCSIVRVQQASIDPKFFVYYSQTQEYLRAVDDLCSGTTRRRISRKNLGNVPVPLPPLDEQKRIVAILDQAFAALDRARALAEANLADARALFKIKLDSTFKSFASKECRIDELFEVGSSKRVLKSEWKDSGVPFYRGREVTRLAQEGRVDNELFISESHYDELAAKTGVPSPGDILITAIGTIGNAYIVQEGDRFYFKDASVLWMRRTSEVLSAYVKLWIRSSSFYDQLERGNGATVDTLTIGKLQGLLIPNFPEKDQERIVEDLIALERKVGCLESLYKSKLTDLANLRQSLLQKAFSGQLT
ncbi:restriction endonuclease subunit S [Stenotrophomonas sp. Marseille-Q4652]|uniref:restriction endonuclease subunit S n=1 Tax=Stenotrophomonas sp. Marseille-Q4652 TaxID=2866595 RepID=UPI001CE3CDE7|nr:restriction endonuclease subunit S [Stenotrophomonas sp. Marseille-Q4652]